MSESRRPGVYPALFRAVFGRMDPEAAHRAGFGAIRAAGKAPAGNIALHRALAPADPALAVDALGLRFPGPLGLAAGFDKNGVGIDALGSLGFAFVEIGTITAKPQPGNPPPRLFRLPPDRALVNRMGFNNDGSAVVADRLRDRRRSRRAARAERTILGINIGKTKATPEAEAIADYVESTERLAPFADYLVVNVSSPNTPGLRDLQAVEVLRPLLLAVREAAVHSAGRQVPLLVKIAPDLADDDIDAVADLAVEIDLDGIIATNTTIGREGLLTRPEDVASIGAGGLSGAPLRARSLDVLKQLRARVGEQLVLISVGGVETADDVWERLRSGATLVQGYTAFIYRGPFWAARIHRELASRMQEEKP